MIIYGKYNDDKSIKNKTKNGDNRLNIDYKIGEIKINVLYDYYHTKNFGTYLNYQCLIIGQPYYFGKKIFCKQLCYLLTRKSVYVLKKLSGSFLLFIYNSRKNTFLIYRSILFMDNIYYKIKNGIEFSNQLKCFSIGDKRLISREFINEFLGLPLISYIEYSPFIDIYRIIPGQLIEIKLNNNEIKKKYAKKLCLLKKITKLTENESKSIFFELFEDSVRDLLKTSNKNIKIYASGGLDSSAITYMIHSIIVKDKLDKNIMLVHKKYVNDSIEKNYLEELNRITNFPIAYEEIKEGSIFGNIDITKKIDIIEPSVELLCKDDDNDCYSNIDETVFSGYGGDQLLYPNLIDESDSPLEKLFSRINSKKIILNKLNRICSQHLKDGLIREDYLIKYDIICNREKKLLLFGHKNPYKTIKYANYYLLYPFNINNSFDIKYPFCDERLIDFCFNMNSQYYCNDGITKYIFRKAFTNILPDKIIERKDKTATYNTFF